MIQQMVLVGCLILVTVVAANSQTAGPPSWALGDTWKLSDGRELTIVKAGEAGYVRRGDLRDCPSCLVYFNKDALFTGEITDADGKPVDVTKVRGAFFGPSWKFYDWPLEVKKKWSFSADGYFRAQSQRYDIDANVKAYEQVKTKAGTFQAFKIEYNWKIENPHFGWRANWTTTSWFAPEAKHAVKFATTAREGVEWELVSYTLK